MAKLAGVRVVVTLTPAIALRLDAAARRGRRSRARAAAEIIAENLRAVMLEPEDMPAELIAEAAAIQAQRRTLAHEITGGQARQEQPPRPAEARGAPSGGSNPPARHWGSKARRGHSGAMEGGSAHPKRGAETPAKRQKSAA